MWWWKLLFWIVFHHRWLCSAESEILSEIVPNLQLSKLIDMHGTHASNVLSMEFENVIYSAIEEILTQNDFLPTTKWFQSMHSVAVICSSKSWASVLTQWPGKGWIIKFIVFFSLLLLCIIGHSVCLPADDGPFFVELWSEVKWTLFSVHI